MVYKAQQGVTMPARTSSKTKLASAFRCPDCSYSYISPMPIISVSHKCYGKSPAGERRALRVKKVAK